jgi:2,3-bisphosphoglycerate-independent phosphoglycerate mutase
VNGSVLESLVIRNESKIVLLVLDGVGDIPDSRNGWKTPLEAAQTPNFDAFMPEAALGRILPVAPGITPGSGPGHLALFGYDPVEVTVGRGVLEALGAGMPLQPGDIAARANFCTMDPQGIVTDRRAGRIASEDSAKLVEMLKKEAGRIDDVEVILQAGRQHRFVALLRGEGLAGGVTDADPHHEGDPIPDARALEDDPAAQKTAHIVNRLVARMKDALQKEPRANAALMRGVSARPHFPGYRERFQLRAAAIAAYPMYRGVAELAGMAIIPVGDAPDDAFAAARERWNDFDYFFIHIKGTDMAGEDGNFAAKVAAIEAVDAALPRLLSMKPDVLCVTGDHSTPVPASAHSWHPVPVFVHGRLCGADRAPHFHEKTARGGSLGDFASKDLMAVLLANALRLDKYGA